MKRYRILWKDGKTDLYAANSLSDLIANIQPLREDEDNIELILFIPEPKEVLRHPEQLLA